MSDTPRTDAMELEIELGQNAPYRMKYLARELERENSALRSEIESLKDSLAALAVATMPKQEDEL